MLLWHSLAVQNLLRLRKRNTVIVDGEGNKEEIQARIGQIRAQLEETTSEFDKKKNYRKDLQNWQAA